MWTERFSCLAFCATLAVPASAQYASAPFHDRPIEVGRAALAVFDGEEIEIPAQDPALAAAVAAMLLISEDGLAEAYEEAVEGSEDDEADDDATIENDPYMRAFMLLQMVRAWIAVLPTDSGSQAAIEDLMARLDVLMPSPEVPEHLDADPEAAEGLAQALVGVLETAADADLYLGRDLRRAIETIVGLVETTCHLTDIAESRQNFRVVALFHENTLEAPLSVMAPDSAEEIEEALDLLAQQPEGPSEACELLAAAYAEASDVLFPEASR